MVDLETGQVGIDTTSYGENYKLFILIVIISLLGGVLTVSIYGCIISITNKELNLLNIIVFSAVGALLSANGYLYLCMNKCKINT